MRLLNLGHTGINGSLYCNRTSGKCYNNRNNVSASCDFSKSGLTSTAKNMIGDAKWYIAAPEFDIIIDESYIQERGTVVGLPDTGITVNKTTNWTGKVGLMNPSDAGLIVCKKEKI